MGGMERQLLSIASGYCDRGNNVFIVSLDAQTPEPFFESDFRITFIGLGVGDASKRATFKERLTRQVRVYKLLKLEKIDVSIAFMTGSFWYSAIPSRLSGTPIVLAERNGPSIYTRTRARKIKSLIFASMILASVITVQFDSYVSSYPRYLRRRIIVIPNKIATFQHLKYPNEGTFRYIFAGRLSNQKQINELIEAFILFHAECPNTQLDVFGEGEQRERVLELINANGAEKYIFLHPPTKDIQEALALADAMVAPSLWEGFPNSVAEALACGVPVGGFEDCEGVRDLITSGSNGWLVQRADPILSQVELLNRIYSGINHLDLYSCKARESVQQFQGEESNQRWSEIIHKLLR
jgi:glycosyltransferase involved in cell wall biosynthesis